MPAKKSPVSITSGRKQTPAPTTPKKSTVPDKEHDPVAIMSIDQIADPDLQESIRQLALRVYELKGQKKAAELELEGIKADPEKGVKGQPGLSSDLAELLRIAGVKTALLDLGDNRILSTSYYRGTTVSLNKELLLAAGVPADVIDSCYTRTPYVTVQTSVKEAKD